MTDENRCEPPPELRDRDGWHWLDLVGFTRPAPYHWIAKHQGWEELGLKRPADYIYRDGYRYLAPVTPPATVAALVAERDALLAEKAAYESPAWEANERLNAQVFALHNTVAALVEALEAFSVAIPAVLDAADIDAADTVFTVRAVSPTGSRELAQRSLADMLEAARAALALYREAGR